MSGMPSTVDLDARTDLERARFNMIEQQIRPWDVLDQDVLDLLLGPGAEVVGERGRKLSEDERRILGAVEGGAGTADAVATCGLGLARVLPALGALERAGYLASDATGRLLRTGLAAPPEGAGGSL